MNGEKLYQTINYVMDRVREMDVYDMGVLKVCLVSFGILIGAFASKVCRRLAPLLIIAFIASYIFLIYRLLIAPALSRAEE